MSKKTKRFSLTSFKAITIYVLVIIFAVPSILKIYSEVKYKNYAKNQQIETIATALNFDLAHVLPVGTNPRFIHNNGESIQVVVEETLSEHISYIKDAMDYILNVINSVNNLYSYKFIAKNEVKNSISTIIFEEKDLNYSEAGEVDEFKIPTETLMLSKTLLNRIHISIDKQQLRTMSESCYYYIYLHEITHAFCLRGDTYLFQTTDEYLGNTMINIDLGQKVPMLTPNDFSSAYSLYTPHIKNKEELNEKIENYKNLLKQYELEYNKFYTSQAKKYILGLKNNQVNFTDFDLTKDFKFLCSNNPNSFDYEISYTNNAYTIKIFDKNKTLLDEYSGKVLYDNQIMVLKDVKLKHGLEPISTTSNVPNGYIQDLILFKDNNKISFFDLCKCYILEGEIIH